MENDNTEKSNISREEQMTKWSEEIRNNEIIKEYFKSYNPKSVESFVADYVKAKNEWYTYGPAYKDDAENKSIRWIAAASVHLAVILQKKLFDVQCLWRAEQLEIPEIQLCCEFLEWENDILNCPFVEPLTEEDIALYQLYLLQCPLFIETDFYDEWQNMDNLRDRFQNEEQFGNFPEWYDFFNLHRGTEGLMLLPDIRGQKEEFYLNLSRIERQKKFEKELAEQVEKPDSRPWLSSLGKEVEEFVSRFESSDCRRLFNSYKYFLNRMHNQEDLEWELGLLSEAEEIIPMEAHTNWKTAIQNAARKYERKMIAEALPQAWEQYRINIDLGIGFPVSSNSDKGWLADLYKGMILRGRVLNGEPEDLMF